MNSDKKALLCKTNVKRLKNEKSTDQLLFRDSEILQHYTSGTKTIKEFLSYYLM